MKKNYVFKIDIMKLNIVSYLILLGCIVFTIFVFPHRFIGLIDAFDNIKTVFLIFPMMLLYFILHELFHALGYVINGADYKKITFGMEIEKGVLYCLCKQNVSRKNILFSVMYPLFFLGIVTYIIGIIFNYPLLTILSIANISGAAGDIMYFLFLVRLDNHIEYSEMDDGTSFVIVSNDPVDSIKHFGLTYAGEIDRIPRKDFKRIKISKKSIWVLVICMVAMIIGIFI